MRTMRKVFAIALILGMIMSSVCLATVRGVEQPKNSTKTSHPKAKSRAAVLISDEMTVYEMVNASNRVATTAMMYVDYCMLFDGDSQEISYGRSAYICARSAGAIDLYIPMIDGDYENLYYSTKSGEITDYGRKSESSFMNDTEHKFIEVDGQRILKFLQEVSDAQ